MATSSDDDDDDDDDVNAFFGRIPLRTNLWTRDDLAMGRAMVHHYQCHTLPAIQAGTTTTADTVTITIPQLIHFIWLGNKCMPLTSNSDDDDDENECIRCWRHYHPTWTIKIWRDADIPPNLQNKAALDHAMQHGNYGMASDILRLELLWEHGGIYVDIDYLCVAPMDDLLAKQSFDFYCGASHTGAVELNNGMLAVTTPHHFLLEQLMQSIHTWFTAFLQQSQPFDVMAAFLDPSSRSTFQQVMALTESDVIRNTGPGLLTLTLARALQQHTGDMTRVAILPFSVFHPLPNTFRGQRHILLQEQVLEEHVVRGQTKAIHLWQCSWQQSQQQSDDCQH
jgi:hypothetical protein